MAVAASLALIIRNLRNRATKTAHLVARLATIRAATNSASYYPRKYVVWGYGRQSEPWTRNKSNRISFKVESYIERMGVCCDSTRPLFFTLSCKKWHLILTTEHIKPHFRRFFPKIYFIDGWGRHLRPSNLWPNIDQIGENADLLTKNLTKTPKWHFYMYYVNIYKLII